MMTRTFPSSSRGRRGSVFILVVAVLSVLVLLTLTLSYISRMDLLASRNWANTVQSRMAAVTGVPLFMNGYSNNNVAYSSRPVGSGGMSGLSGQLGQMGPMGPMGQMGRMGQHGRIGRIGQIGQIGQSGTMGQNGLMGRNGQAGMMAQTMAMQRSTELSLKPLKLELELQEGREAGVEMSPATQVRTALAARGQGQAGMALTGMRTRSRRSISGISGMTGARGMSGFEATGEAAANLATALIEDESGKLNINAVVPDGVAGGATGGLQSGGSGKVPDAPDQVTEAMLAKLITEVAAVNQLGGVDATGLAHRIALRRYGKDGRPGRAFTDDNANNGMTDPLHDGIDNDHDGQIDEDDELPAATAHDGLDNNRNGVIDEPGESIAQDGLDNNHNGVIDEPNEAIDDPAEASSDPRKPAVGDDVLYSSLEELMAVDGMTPALYRALSPYLTTFSVSFAAYTVDEDQARGMRASQSAGGMGMAGRRAAPGPNASDALAGRRRSGVGSQDDAAMGLPQVDPNTAPPELLYAVLKQRFPDAGDDLLGQFIANLIDRRDQDNLPTTIRIGSRSYTGIEINPCINEICPDPTPGDNNDGQYIELYNPWSQAVSLNGWSLRGSGIQTPLNGSLPTGGFLVLTNDINNENDSTPEDDGNEGSFYNVFHKVGTGGQHQLVEIQGMNLPVSGKVQLVNPQGMVVDEFVYSGGQCSGAAKSFQRTDPRLRAAEFKAATPLEANQGEEQTSDNMRVLRMMEQWQNQPFRSPLDVMLVSTAYAAAGSAGTSQIVNALDHAADNDDQDDQMRRDGTDSGFGQAGVNKTDVNDTLGDGDTGAAQHAYAMPQLSTNGRDNLDVRLVDCFRIGAMLPSESATPASDLVGTLPGANGRPASGAQSGMSSPWSRNGQMDRSMMSGSLAGGASASGRARLPEPPDCQAVFGRVNLNTAPAAVLATLPGMDTQLVAKIVASRERGLDRDPTGNSQTSMVSANSVTGNNWTWWVAESPFAKPRWENLSDVLLDESLWEGRPLYDRLDAVYAWSQLVTMHTMSVLVATASRPSEPVAANGNGPMAANGTAPARGTAQASSAAPANSAMPVAATRSGKRPSLARTERIIAGDRGAPETVMFKFMGIYGTRQVDPDAVYAAPASKMKPTDPQDLLARVVQAGGKVARADQMTRRTGSGAVLANPVSRAAWRR